MVCWTKPEVYMDEGKWREGVLREYSGKRRWEWDRAEGMGASTIGMQEFVERFGHPRDLLKESTHKVDDTRADVSIEARIASAEAAIEQRKDKARRAFERDWLEPLRRVGTGRMALPAAGPTLRELFEEKEQPSKGRGYTPQWSPEYFEVTSYGSNTPQFIRIGGEIYLDEVLSPDVRPPKTGEHVAGKGIVVEVSASKGEPIRVKYRVVSEESRRYYDYDLRGW